MRGRAALRKASAARRTSCSAVRHNAATVTFRHSAATALTAAKSPSEAIGNPASIISTPSDCSFRARSSFSVRFIEQPGDCSPSRKVLSKILIRSTFFIPHPRFLIIEVSGNSRTRSVESQSYNSYDKITICDTITRTRALDNRALEYQLQLPVSEPRAVATGSRHVVIVPSRLEVPVATARGSDTQSPTEVGTLNAFNQSDGHKPTGSISGSSEREEFFARSGSVAPHSASGKPGDSALGK